MRHFRARPSFLRSLIRRQNIRPTRETFRWVRSWGIFTGLILLSRVALATPYIVPSGSMQPTLLIGDYLVAQPLAYGISTANLPFGDRLPWGRRLFQRLPLRGDVVVFRSPARPGITFVKRVIGLPGDRIGLSGGRVWLNGRELPWRDEGPAREELSDGSIAPAERFTETLPGGTRHLLLKTPDGTLLDDMAEITIPAGHLFVMGDNRDNSADSRVPQAEGGVGLLPVWNLQGKVMVITASRDSAASHGGVGDYLASIRPARFLKWVE